MSLWSKASIRTGLKNLVDGLSEAWVKITTRWEVESTIDELKVHHKARQTPIREAYPREVVQEVYGWLLGHWAIRSLMFQVADSAQISPLRLGNTCTQPCSASGCDEISAPSA